MITLPGKYTTAKIMIDDIEPQCLAQITQMVNHPAFNKPVAIQPDTHAGKGSVIGFTMPLGDKVIPAVVGVDLGCGVSLSDLGTANFNTIDLVKLDNQIRALVPMGFNVHEERNKKFFDLMDWEAINYQIYRIYKHFGLESPKKLDSRSFGERCKKMNVNLNYVQRSLGTLGGGNHFIEIGQSPTSDIYYAMVHTGSRNFGLKVCNYWQKVAQKRLNHKRNVEFQNRIKEIKATEDSSQWESLMKEARSKLDIDFTVNTKNLESLEGEDMLGYLTDMVIAQHYASLNRAIIIQQIHIALGLLNKVTYSATKLNNSSLTDCDTIHNYISFNDMVIRKGSVSAHKEEMFVVPLNMRDGTLVCKGKGNKEWNNSAPHGAGRTMSRRKAKDTLSLADFKEQMRGVYSTSVQQSTLDEAPGAYKDGEMIEKLIGPTAEITDKILPILSIKAC